MLTIFSTPKPFEGLADVHQRNAVGSWTRLGAEVLLLHADRDAARELGARCVPEVEGLDGLPYVRELFGLAESLALHDLLVYANADVILLPGLLSAVERAAECFERFLMVGRRWDIELTERLEFGPGWEAELRERVQKCGRLHSESGKDWFAFRHPLGLEFPLFVVGRVTWDNWLLDAALGDGVPVVDATTCVTAVHQEHGYPDGWLWDGLAEHNRALCRVPPNRGRISEADWEMTQKEIRRR
jgi:hypothetical protein